MTAREECHGEEVEALMVRGNKAVGEEIGGRNGGGRRVKERPRGEVEVVMMGEGGEEGRVGEGR